MEDLPAGNVMSEKEEDNQVNGNQLAPSMETQLQLVKEENQVLMNDNLRRRINRDDDVFPKPKPQRSSGTIDGSSHSSMPLLLTAAQGEVAPSNNNNSVHKEPEGTTTEKVRVSVRLKTEEDKVRAISRSII